MGKTISYINNRIISNIGSVSTSVGVNANAKESVELINSFSDISKYGFNFNDNTAPISDSEYYHNSKLTLNNILPPFEMELQFKEYYLDHIGTDYKQKIQSTPFSPLNTVFFAKSMMFSHDLKMATTDAELINIKNLYNYNNNDKKKIYFEKVLSVYKNIPPAILFASSLPIDTNKLTKLIYDDLKIPGVKQVPYTFALWLGAKWHYYKHSNEIFMGQDNWYKIDNQGIINGATKSESKKALYGSDTSNTAYNLADLTNYTEGIKMFRDNVAALNINTRTKVKYTGDITTVGLTLKGKTFELYKDHKIYSVPLDGKNGQHITSFVLPTRNGSHKFSNAVAGGIGINNALLIKTYNYLEDSSLTISLRDINKMISAGIIGNLKHYDFSNDNGYKHIIVNGYFDNDLGEINFAKKPLVSYSKDDKATNKFDIIRKYYDGVSPWTLTLKHYPKFTDSRTVDINGIYSVTTPFILDEDEAIKNSHTVEKIFNASKDSKLTVSFYNELRNYILYRVKLTDKVTKKKATINQHIEAAYKKIDIKDNNPFTLLSEVNKSEFIIDDDDLIEFMLIILANFSNQLGGVDNMLNVFTNYYFTQVKQGERKVIHSKIVKIYNEKVGKYVKINPEYIQLVTAVTQLNREFNVNSDTRQIIEGQNISSPMIVYPKLLMDLLHGFIEITASSENNFHPLIRTYSSSYNKPYFTNDEITAIKYAGVIQGNTNKFDNKEGTIGTLNHYPEPAKSYTNNNLGIKKFSAIVMSAPVKISTDDFKFIFELEYTGYNTLRFGVLKIVEKIIQEQIVNRVSLSYNHVSKFADNFVAKLYPSAGGTINLSYGLNTHLYTDASAPIVDASARQIISKNNQKTIINANGSWGLKYINHEVSTIIDPRVIRNHASGLDYGTYDFTKHVFNSNKTLYTDTLMLGNLENIRNSGLRYLWYSGPYFGAQTAQLSLEKIIYSVGNIVDNVSDITTIPRTNYINKTSEYAQVSDHILNIYTLNKSRSKELKVDMSNYDCYTDFGIGDELDNTYGLQIGATPNGYNLSTGLSFNTVVKQLGSDMLNQFEGIFLDFCRPRKSNSSVIDFDETMKLLMMVDENDVSGELYYPSFNNNAIIKIGKNGSTPIADNAFNTLSESDQRVILGLPPMESDSDLVSYVGHLSSPGQHAVLKQSDFNKRVTLSYLKNIVLTNAQYNRAKKILNYLGSSTNDVYVKRNWVQNSADNNLVLFYTQNSAELSTLTIGDLKQNNKLVGKLYSNYITNLFDDNYSPSKNRITNLYQTKQSSDLIDKAFQGNYNGGQESITNGYSYSYLENRAYSFMHSMISAFNDINSNQPWVKSASTCVDIEFAIFNEMAKLRSGSFFNFYSDKNSPLLNLDTPEKIGSYVLNFSHSISASVGNEIFRKVITNIPDAHNRNSQVRSDIVKLYKIFLNRCFNVLFDDGKTAPYLNLLDSNGKTDKQPSQYLQTLIDEIELLALNVIREKKPKNIAAFNNDLILGANNFLATSYQNTKKYFDKHMGALLYVIEQSALTKNVENQGLTIADKNAISSEKLKIKPYYNIKKIHDTWLYNAPGSTTNSNAFYYISYYDEPCQIKEGKLSFSNTIGNKLFGNYFHIVDRGNNDLSEKLIIDPDFFLKYLLDIQGTKNGTGVEGTKVYLNTTNLEMSMYTFFGDVAKKHNSLFHALPSFNGIGLAGNVDKGNTLGDEMFQTYNYLKQKEAPGPHFIFQYIGAVTSSLDTPHRDRDKMFDKRNSFCLEDFENLPKELITNDTTNYPSTTGFVVQFGEQNQQIFSNIVLDQSEFSNTEEYYDVITNLTKNGNVKTVGNDLYKIYDARSYTATITSMGNMEIEPLMYFYLKNVPLFKGSYWITNVSHEITPNNITTTFKGVRQPIANIKPTSELFVQINREYIKKLGEINSGQTSSSTTDTVKVVSKDTMTPKKSNRLTSSKAVNSDGSIDLQKLVSAHYTLADLSSMVAVAEQRHSIKPQLGLSSAEIAINLTNIAVNVADKIKEQYPYVIITSGFRPDKSDGSQHYKGEALDFQFIKAVKNKDMVPIAEWIRDNLVYDQLIFEHKKNVVIHVSFSNSDKQRMWWGTMKPNQTKHVVWGTFDNYFK